LVISALLTWGYLHSRRQDLAEAHFQRNTMAAHAVAFPDVWAGTWSGPDGLQGLDPGNTGPGMSWYSPATPMTDFPVQNNNQHALPLWAMLKLAGVETLADGLSLSPHLARFSLRTRLLDLDAREGVYSGTWRPTGPGATRLVLTAPAGTHLRSAMVNGQALQPSGDQATATPAQFPATFELRFSP